MCYEQEDSESKLSQHSSVLVPAGNPFLHDIGKRNHAHCLPNSQSNSGSNTSVKSLDTTFLVDESHRVEHGKFCWSVNVGAFSHTLHLRWCEDISTEISEIEKNDKRTTKNENN